MSSLQTEISLPSLSISRSSLCRLPLYFFAPLSLFFFLASISAPIPPQSLCPLSLFSHHSPPCLRLSSLPLSPHLLAFFLLLLDFSSSSCSCYFSCSSSCSRLLPSPPFALPAPAPPPLPLPLPQALITSSWCNGGASDTAPLVPFWRFRTWSARACEQGIDVALSQVRDDAPGLPVSFGIPQSISLRLVSIAASRSRADPCGALGTNWAGISGPP